MTRAPLPPLPWEDVNAARCATVAGVLNLRRADRRGGYPCPVCQGARLLPVRKGDKGGWICWSGCNGVAYSNVDLAAAVWGETPAGAVQRLADALGIMCSPGGAPVQETRRLARARVQRTETPAAPSLPDPLAALAGEGMVVATPADIGAAASTLGRVLRTPDDCTALAAALAASFHPLELWRAGLWTGDTLSGAVALPAVPLPAVVTRDAAGCLAFLPLSPTP